MVEAVEPVGRESVPSLRHGITTQVGFTQLTASSDESRRTVKAFLRKTQKQAVRRKD
jgi:hypothetical protein